MQFRPLEHKRVTRSATLSIGGGRPGCSHDPGLVLHVQGKPKTFNSIGQRNSNNIDESSDVVCPAKDGGTGPVLRFVVNVGGDDVVYSVVPGSPQCYSVLFWETQQYQVAMVIDSDNVAGYCCVVSFSD